MYKHILVATDGSKLSSKAIKTAARLARSLRARLTGVYVNPEFVAPMYSEASGYVPRISPKRFRELTAKEARKALSMVETEAQTEGVECSTMSLPNNHPYLGILRAAQLKKCDLIVMASHGRRGLSAMILGSETNKLLTHSSIPVLVCR
jgi:nucleotide-binding universal stress UspA family protein